MSSDDAQTRQWDPVGVDDGDQDVSGHLLDVLEEIEFVVVLLVEVEQLEIALDVRAVRVAVSVVDVAWLCVTRLAETIACSMADCMAKVWNNTLI